MTTSEPSIEDTVRKIVEQQLNLAAHGRELGSDDNLWDLGMTSLTCLGLMLNLEDELGVELPEDLLKESTFRSVGAIVAAVDSVREPAGESVRAR